jgi:putative phosphoribosyl transferase
MLAAVQAVRKQHPSRVVVAVPVGASDTCHKLGAIADEVVCDLIPEPFHAVGLWYENFAQTTDDEVNRLLDEAQRQQAARQAAGMPGSAAGTEKTRHPPG